MLKYSYQTTRSLCICQKLQRLTFLSYLKLKRVSYKYVINELHCKYFKRKNVTKIEKEL